LSISVRLRNLIKRRPRSDMDWSAIEEEEVILGGESKVTKLKRITKY
jgi:hypothetical protein